VAALATLPCAVVMPVPLAARRLRIPVSIVIRQEAIDASQKALRGGTNLPAQRTDSVGADVVVRHAPLQQRLAHLLEDVAQHRLD